LAPRSRQLAKTELDLAQVAAALLRRQHTADDPLAPAARVIDDDLDRRHPVRCAPSSRATAACYSDKLGAQYRVDALCKSSAQGAATTLAGSEADAYIMVDGEAHATGDEATIAVRPCPSVTLLEDHRQRSLRQRCP
jgi:hypothetical protein